MKHVVEFNFFYLPLCNLYTSVNLMFAADKKKLQTHQKSTSCLRLRLDLASVYKKQLFSLENMAFIIKDMKDIRVCHANSLYVDLSHKTIYILNLINFHFMIVSRWESLENVGCKSQLVKVFVT